MARYSILFSLIGATALILAGCDQLDDPIIPVTTNYLEVVYGPAPTFESLPQGDAVKRVLVEDFTAHQCGNCPAAAIIAEDLVANYEGQISAMAIHAGNLANTDEGYFDTDWTTEEGDVFWDQLDFQANPVGRINRINGVGSFWAPAQWEEKAVEEMIFKSRSTSPLMRAVRETFDKFDMGRQAELRIFCGEEKNLQSGTRQ